MAKVGRFVTDPKAGSYCQIALDSGEKIIVNHEKGASGGHLTIEVSKYLGLSSDRIYTCDLGSPAGQAALGQLTRDARQGSAAATPLGAFVEYVRDCASVAAVKARCAALTP